MYNQEEFNSTTPAAELSHEVKHSEVQKLLRQICKFGKMIDASEVIEGKELLVDLQCVGCKKIPLSLSTKQCKNCHSIVCLTCLFKIRRRISDEIMEESDDWSIHAGTDCPSCACKLDRVKREDKQRAKATASKLQFLH